MIKMARRAPHNLRNMLTCMPSRRVAWTLLDAVFCINMCSRQRHDTRFKQQLLETWQHNTATTHTQDAKCTVARRKRKKVHRSIVDIAIDCPYLKGHILL